MIHSPSDRFAESAVVAGQETMFPLPLEVSVPSPVDQGPSVPTHRPAAFHWDGGA